MVRQHQEKIQQAERHIVYRWVGAPLFGFGCVWLILALQNAFNTGVWYPVMLGMASCLMGLTSFGINHDTAIQLALDVRREDPEVVFSASLHREVTEELSRDYAHALSISGHPTLAMVIPVITLAVHGIEVYLLWFAQ